MRILICGASGFVGRHLHAGLRHAGHEVLRGVRKASASDDVEIDYLNDTGPESWLPRLRGIDAVVNAVGVLRDSAAQPMQKLQAMAPCALFSACAEAGVGRIVHISALGVASPLQTAYYRTRRQAEACLFGLPDPLRWLNLRPSLIYGEDGASARMFRRLAAMPVHALPMGGMQTVQPVHVDDIAAAIGNWLADANAANLSLDAAGGESASLRGMLASYREQMGLRPAVAVSMPAALVRLAARIGDFLPASPLCSDTLAMLESGNTGNAEAFARLLGRPPASYRNFIQPRP